MSGGGTVDSLEAKNRIHALEEEVQYLVGIINVMKDDLQIKDEQFEFLYSSIKARGEQFIQSKQMEDDILRARVFQLENSMDQLQIELRSANKKIMVLNRTANSKCCFNKIPFEILLKIMSYVCSTSLVNLSMVDKYTRLCATESFLWVDLFRVRWGGRRLNELQKEIEYINADNDQSHIGQILSWHAIYSKCRQLENNWFENKQRVSECKGHSGTITCLVVTNNSTMISGESVCHMEWNGICPSPDLHHITYTYMYKYMCVGSDDGSMLLWELPQRNTSCIALSKDKSWNLPFTNDSPKPPPILPLAQLVEAGNAGYISKWKPRR